MTRGFAGEHEVAGRGEHRRTHRKAVGFPPPDLLARRRTEGAYGPLHVLGVHDDVRSPVRHALLELPAPPRDRRTGILHRAVEELRLRVEARVRPFLAPGRPRVKVDLFPLILGVYIGRYVAFGVDLAPGDTVDEGCYPDQLTVRAVEDEEVPVLVEVPQQLAPVLL